MRECPICHRQVGTVDSCKKFFSDQVPFGKQRDIYDKIDYRHFINCVRYVFRCPDCWVSKEGYHHYGCPSEECPECHEKLLSCEHREIKKAPE